MNYAYFVLTTVKKFTEQKKMFTSIDIANEVKREGLWVRNTEVRDWLHNNFLNKTLFHNYSTSQITLYDGHTQATLYHPVLANPEEYSDRDQLPLTPDQVKAIKKVKVGQYKSDLNIKDLIAPEKKKDTKRKSKRVKGKNVKINSLNSDSVVLCSVDRLRIPGEYIRKLGWKPGDKIDPSVILTTKVISGNLKVNHDYRVSIPRSAVPWGIDPVKVSYENGKIHFSKAKKGE